MTIGICRLVLYLPECGSLKHKRQVLKSLSTRVRNKFNVSVSELEDNDLWQKAQLGVAIISNDSRHANRVLSNVVNLVEREAALILTDYSMEMF